MRDLTAIFKMDNQQGPTVQHRELCSMLCDGLDGRGERAVRSLIEEALTPDSTDSGGRHPSLPSVWSKCGVRDGQLSCM